MLIKFITLLKKMHLLKISLLLSIVIFVIISFSNKVLTKRRVLNKKHSHHKQHEKLHKDVHHKNTFFKNKLHHIHNNDKRHGHHNLELHHRQVTRINPILESDLCRIGHTPRIVGGYTANETSFSHAVNFYFCKAYSITGCQQWCGGSIISKIHILTAAHCMFDPTNFLKPIENYELLVRAHVKNLSEPEVNYGPYRTTFQVHSVFVHNGYQKDSLYLQNDIALVKLVQPMIHGVPICINGLHFNYDLKTYPNLIVAGWGNVASGGPLSNVLKYTYLYVTNCSNNFNAGVFCATSPFLVNGYTCQGDSGSGVLPLKQNGDAVNLIVGIVSAGSSNNFTDCMPPLVFTNVTTYAQWINEYVAK